MVRVTVELIPHSDESQKRLLGIAEISNDGVLSTETRGRYGSYDVTLSKWAPLQNQIWKRGRVDKFDRLRRGPWDLLYLALSGIVGGRNR